MCFNWKKRNPHVEGVAEEVLYVLSPWSSIREKEDQDVLRAEKLVWILKASYPGKSDCCYKTEPCILA
jgi:hypothetical protein